MEYFEKFLLWTKILEISLCICKLSDELYLILLIASFLDNKSTSEEKKQKPLKWDEDMQLYSRFLDRKVKYSEYSLLPRLYNRYYIL